MLGPALPSVFLARDADGTIAPHHSSLIPCFRFRAGRNAPDPPRAIVPQAFLNQRLDRLECRRPRSQQACRAGEEPRPDLPWGPRNWRIWRRLPGSTRQTATILPAETAAWL